MQLGFKPSLIYFQSPSVWGFFNYVTIMSIRE